MKTWIPKGGEELEQRRWWVVDANGQTVGRMATTIAKVLRGKHKPVFTPHADAGDFVVVINSDKAKFTGNKMLEKKYYWKSRFFGSLRERTAEQLMQEKPEVIIERAVKGMLPKNRLARQQIKKLKIYTGAEHPHQAQRPEALKI